MGSKDRVWRPRQLSRRDALKAIGFGALGLAGCTVGRPGKPPRSTVTGETASPTGVFAPSPLLPATPTAVPATPLASATPGPTFTGSLATATLGTPTVDVTFENIALEIPYTPAAGHDGSDLAATIQYRPWGTTQPWRTALPPQNVWHNPAWDCALQGSSTGTQNQWRWDGGLTAFYGSVLQCAAGSSWEVQVTVTDGTGAQAAWGNATAGWYRNDTSHAAVRQGGGTAITTRAEDLPDAATLTPTHYVSPSGNDANAGTDAAHPWQTLDYAIQQANAASADMVIQFAPGSYQNTARYLTGHGGHRITLKAEHPAVLVDGSGTRTVSGSGYSVIEDPSYTTPGQQDGNGNPIWQLHTMTSPNGASYTCYKATLLPVCSAAHSPAAALGINMISAAKDLTSLPREISFWDRKPGTVTTTDGTKTYDELTPASWLEVLNVNYTYRYGGSSWADGSTDTRSTTLNTGYGTDLYLVMPPLQRASDGQLSQDPNDFYIHVGFNADASKHAADLIVNGPNIRLSGLVFRHISLNVYNTGDRGVIDHTWFANCGPGVLADFGSGYPTPSAYSHDVVIQDNIVQNTNNRTLTSDADHCQPWQFVKQDLRMPNSPSTAPWGPDGGGGVPGEMLGTGWRRTGTFGESTGIGGYGMGRRLVIRRNDVSGGFDGIGTGDNEQYDRYAWYAGDVCDNDILLGNDDGFSPAQKEINLHFFRNRIWYQQDCISSSYTNVGPIYIYRNTFWETGFQMSAHNVDGSIVGDNPITKYGDFIAIQPCLTYMIHNTIWTDDPANAPGGAKSTSGWGATGNSPSPGAGYSQLFYLRNNLYRTSGNVWAPMGWTPGTGWNEDYNAFASDYYLRGGADQFGGGMKLYSGAGTGGAGSDTVSGYRLLSGGVCGTHSNTLAGFDDAFGSSATVTAMDRLFVNASGGTLSLVAGSPAIDAGVAMPGISGYDLLGGTYFGSAPDLGAIERPS